MDSETSSSNECATMDRDETDLKESSNILEKFPYLQNDGLIQRAKCGVSCVQTFTKKVTDVESICSENLSLESTCATVLKSALSSYQPFSVKSHLIEAKELNLGKKNDAFPVKGDSSEENVENENNIGRPQKPHRISFILKGRLGHDMDKIIKSVKETLIEPVDVEESFSADIVHSYATQVKTDPCSSEAGNVRTLADRLQFDNSQKSTQQGQKTDGLDPSVEKTSKYMEPSIADIRAGFLGTTNSNLAKLSATNVNLNIADDEDVVKLEIPSDNDDDISDDDENVTGKESVHSDTWFDSMYPDDTSTPTVKKGGRSDPDNPFAMTSPSFSESAAKALMTTTQSSNATIVMVSIMSIGSRAKLIPKVVESMAAQGGIVTVVNPILAPDTKETQTVKEPEVNILQASAWSKPKRDGYTRKEEDSEIDRLDINVRIEDDQFTGHGETKRWLCRLCPKSYTTKHNLVAHILDHSDIKPHLCLVCGKYFKQLSHLNTHMLTHDNIKPHVCTICNKGFTQISHLKRHETVHMGSKPYICDLCNRGFAYPSELRLHKDKHVCGTEKCMECNMEFESWDKLQEHLASSQHCNNLQCKHCDRFFKFPSLLRDHMLTHVGSRPYICSECGMDFMKEHHLRSHQFTHTGLKPFSCPLCARSFNQKANMQRHMLIHNAKRAYKCDVCSKTFTQPQTLKAHMVVHSDTKPYECELCGKQFGRQHNLQGHMHMHSDSKPYSCTMCSSSFTLKGNLNRHKKVKHGLDESTELMEEDAVNFLSTLSDRGRDANLSDDDNDLDPPGELSRSYRKGQQSALKKRIRQSSVNKVDDESNEGEQMISYSDEERENDRIQCNKIGEKFLSVDTYYVEIKDKISELSGKETCDVDSNMSVTSVATDTRSLRKRKKKDYGDDFIDCNADKRLIKAQKYH